MMIIYLGVVPILIDTFIHWDMNTLEVIFIIYVRTRY